MNEFCRALQNSAFSVWVVSSDSIWAYPMILTLHTVGLAIVVGAAIVIDLRLLGVGLQIPLVEMNRAFRIFWLGFLIKLTLIAVGVITTTRIRRVVFRPDEPSDRLPRAARTLAAASLVLWAGAIVAGRLMAYL